MEHTQTLTRSQTRGDSFSTVLHVVSHASFRLAAGEIPWACLAMYNRLLDYVRQVSNGQDKVDKVFIRQNGTGKCTRQKFSLSLFFRHHGQIRWGREDDIVIME